MRLLYLSDIMPFNTLSASLSFVQRHAARHFYVNVMTGYDVMLWCFDMWRARHVCFLLIFLQAFIKLFDDIWGKESYVMFLH